jgi:hypothetical protein
MVQLSKKDSGEYMRYFEDFHVGDTFELGPLVVTEEEIISFAKQYDPQYFHIDPERAKDSIFGGLVASGWHTTALFMRMFVDDVLSKMIVLVRPAWMRYAGYNRFVLMIPCMDVLRLLMLEFRRAVQRWVSYIQTARYLISVVNCLCRLKVFT